MLTLIVSVEFFAASKMDTKAPVFPGNGFPRIDGMDNAGFTISKLPVFFNWLNGAPPMV
jgi:hypothetical protein